MARADQSSFDAEILLDELEARFAAALDQRIRAAWRGWTRGQSTAPPWPAGFAHARTSLTRLGKDVADPLVRRRLEVASREATEAELATRCGTTASVAERNAVARAMGADDFHRLSLYLHDLTDDDIDARLAVAPGIAPAGDASSLDVALRRVPPAELVRRVSATLPRTRHSPTVSLLDRVGARTFTVRAPDEVHCVVGPVRDARGWRELWHELGHGFAATCIDESLPWPLARVSARCLDEAVAERFATLGEDPSVLQSVLDLPFAEADAVAAHLRYRRGRWRRYQRARAELERDRYTRPDRDPGSMWVRLVERHTGERIDADSWRDIDHLHSDPGAQAVYLVAGDLAQTLAASSLSRLAQVLHSGATKRWREVLGALEPAPTAGHDASTR